jgi:hypothetical protein
MAVTLGSQGITYSSGTTQTSSVPDLGAMINVTTFTSSGTWTNPGATTVIVKLVGGGGGGCGYCESGGGGGYAEGVFNVTGVSTVGVTVGGGGTGAGYYQGCPSGGTSSFGSYLSASGGGGANTYSTHSGGLGGIGSGGQTNLQGGTGNGHTNSVGAHAGGRGGSTYFGGSASLVRNHGNNSLFGPQPYGAAFNNGAPGSGGPGQMTDGYYDGNSNGYGSSGIVLVYAFV